MRLNSLHGCGLAPTMSSGLPDERALVDDEERTNASWGAWLIEHQERAVVLAIVLGTVLTNVPQRERLLMSRALRFAAESGLSALSPDTLMGFDRVHSTPEEFHSRISRRLTEAARHLESSQQVDFFTHLATSRERLVP